MKFRKIFGTIAKLPALVGTADAEATSPFLVAFPDKDLHKKKMNTISSHVVPESVAALKANKPRMAATRQ